nr:hypothetical protein [Caldanaerobius fijiensis]
MAKKLGRHHSTIYRE